MLIYKILTSDQWADLEHLGETEGAPIDISDGYVHLSTAGQEGLWLLALEADDLGETLKWETSRGGALFPHLYGPLRRSDVIWARELPLGPDGHVFPDDLA